MSTKIKILVYSPYSLQVGGGIETWIFYLAEYFNKYVEDAELIIATNQEHNKKNIRLSKKEVKKKLGKIKWIELPSSKIFSRFRINLLNFKGMLLLRKLIKSSDLIYCNFSTPYDIPWYLSKCGLKKNIVYGFHGEFFLENEDTKGIYDFSISPIFFPLIGPFVEAYKKISFFFLKRENKKLHVVNKNLENFFLYRGLKAKYIPNPIDINKFEIGKKELNKFIVLYVGRLEWIKGADILEKSIRIFNKKYVADVEFWITGKGTYSKDFDRLSKEFKNVKYFGFVSFDKLQDIYEASSLFVSPSYRDPFPFTLLEAQSAGLHVVSTETSGGRIACPIGKILVNIGDSKALADAIYRKYLEWKKNKKEYYQKSKEIRGFVVKNFSFERVFSEIYTYLLSTSS